MIQSSYGSPTASDQNKKAVPQLTEELIRAYEQAGVYKEPGLGERGRRILFAQMTQLGLTTPDGKWTGPPKRKPPKWGEPGDPYTAHLRGETVPD